MKRLRLLLLAFMLLAWGLRLHHLDVQSLWYDEGVTAQVARLGMRQLAGWTAADIQPPLYYLVVGGWLRLLQPWAGSLAYVLRFLSAGFGLLLTPLLWAIGRRLWDERAGLLAAWAATAAPLLVYYGQEARMYALLMVLVGLAALAVVRQTASWGRTGQRGDWLLYAFAGLAALYTHYFAGFALLGLSLYWLIQWRRWGRGRQTLRPFILANLFVLLGFSPWLPAMLDRFQVDSSYWAGALKLGEASFDLAANFTAGATEVMLEGDAGAWLFGFVVAGLAWLSALSSRPRPKPQRPLLLLVLWGLLPIALVLLLAWRTPKFNPRYLLIAWPAWALFIGGGLGSLWSPGLGGGESWMAQAISRFLCVVTFALVLAAQAVGLANWFGNPNFAKSDWRDAIAEMYFNRAPGEAALLVSGHAYPVFDAYLPADLGVPRYRLPEIEILDVSQVLGWEETARALNRDLAGRSGVWLFLWQDEVVDPAQVVTTLLDRFADPLPTPSFPYLGLRHYRLRPDRLFPKQPPATQPGADLGAWLRLTGVEQTPGGLWLYWQALQPDLPDLRTAVVVRDATGSVLARQDGRPAGFDFPTTSWQAGESYPVWMKIGAGEPAMIELTLYDATQKELAAIDVTLP
ncbi:MAG: glycosyltransferase family 39 protein [Caldilineales bacterium]|nr:glycosyltransferase family 39 protein [Caldilineales bacterium]